MRQMRPDSPPARGRRGLAITGSVAQVGAMAPGQPAGAEPGPSWTGSCPITRCGSTPRGGCRSRRRSARCWRATASKASTAIRRSTGRRSMPAATRCCPEIDALIARYRALFGGARAVLGRALRHQRSGEDRRRGAGRSSPSRSRLMPASRTRSPSSASVTSFRSGSPAASARNSRRPPRRFARYKKQLGSRVAAEGPHGARE